jgi:hypothetical protein
MKRSLKITRSFSCAADRLALAVFSGLGSDFALGCFGDFLRGDHQKYLDRTLDISTYGNWRDFYVDYIAVSLMSKFPNLNIEVDRDAVALEKFLQSERCCAETNSRLRLLYKAPLTNRALLVHVLELARVKIDAVLGEFSWDDAARHFSFGPGATIGLTSSEGDSWYKFGFEKPTTTRLCSGLSRCVITHFHRWRTHLTQISGREFDEDSLEFVIGNRITTVPKNAKTNRVIAIEPLLNMFIQKGIGSLLRLRLKRIGINLDSQEPNQLLAQAGSQDGSLATLDLSSASDSVSLGLVDLLLPPEWVSAIKLCRSSNGVLPDGSVINYHKVSSMGNGYTFELESLIFWALTSSVVSFRKERDSRIAVYGDDIIVPRDCYDDLVTVLNYCGFTTNSKKSFSNGPFRESCGKHFFLGREVTPIYVTKPIDTVERVFWFCNSMKRLGSRFLGLGYGIASQFQDAFTEGLTLLPPYLQKPTVPFNWGDNAIAGDFDEVRPGVDPFTGQYRVHYLRRLYKEKVLGGYPMLLKSLHGLEARSEFLRGSNAGSLDWVQRFERYCVLKSRWKPATASIALESMDAWKIPTQTFKLVPVKGLVTQWVGLGPWVEVQSD